MVTIGKLQSGKYYDSVALMAIAKIFGDVPGVEDVAAVMATDKNKEILEVSGMLLPEFVKAIDTDLILAVKAETKEINKKQFDFITKSTTLSLKNGIKLGLFRKDIQIDFISRLYFKGMIGIRDLDTFPTKLYNPAKLKIDFIEYHLRAIVTEKGLKQLNHFIKKN